MSPHPTLSHIVVVKVSPKVVLPRHGLAPVPGLLDPQIGSVHVRHVPSVSELGKLGPRTKGSLAQIVTHSVTGNIQTAHGVSHSDDTASPSLVERLVGIGVGSEIGVEAIVGTSENFGVDDASDGQPLGAGRVSVLRIAAVAGHPAHEVVLLGRPDGGSESEPPLVADALAVIGEVLRDRV